MARLPTGIGTRIGIPALLGLWVLTASGGRADPAGADPWPALSRHLVGEWVARTEKGREIRISCAPTSGGTALLERFVSSSGSESITVYHPDGAGLVLTHYCPQGNQPRLRASSIDEAGVVFRYADATHLQKGQAVMKELAFRFEKDRLVRTETYRNPDGTDDVTTLELRKVPAKAGSPSAAR